jgi:hypothetical protein
MGKQDVLLGRLDRVEAQLAGQLGQSEDALASLREELGALRGEWAAQLQAEVSRQLSVQLPSLLRQALKESSDIAMASSAAEGAAATAGGGGAVGQEEAAPSSLAELAAASGSRVEELVRLFRSPADLRELMDECGVRGKLRRRRIAIQHASLTRWDSVEAHALARFTAASGRRRLPPAPFPPCPAASTAQLTVHPARQRSTTTSLKEARCSPRPRTRAAGRRSAPPAPWCPAPTVQATSRWSCCSSMGPVPTSASLARGSTRRASEPSQPRRAVLVYSYY